MDSDSEAPRMVDIAHQAGVSRTAVSAVLMGTGQGRVRVSEETAQQIRRIAEEVGYRPNQAARQLAGQRTGMIGIIASDWGNFLTQRALSWLHAEAEKRDIRVVATYARHSTEPIHRLLRDLRSGWLDGFVYLAHENESQWPEVSQLFRGMRNVVVVVGELNAPGVAAVVSDVRGAAVASVEHLAARGRRRPVFVTEEFESAAARIRWDAYRETCAAHGMSFDASNLVVETRGWTLNRPEFYPRFDELARRLVAERRADALLCDNDFMAAGLLRAFRRLGIRVPDDVAVVGWGDLQFAEIFDPTITSVSLNLPELLSRAVSRLLPASLESPEAEVERVSKSLVVRESA